MKKTSFTVKKPSEKAIHYSKEKFQIQYKTFIPDFTIPVDELTTETFYYFRTSELFNI